MGAFIGFMVATGLIGWAAVRIGRLLERGRWP